MIENKEVDIVINFIVCEDNHEMNKMVCNIVDSFMMSNKLAYKKYVFYDYNDTFYKLMNKELTTRIYILDIETPSASGIDMARKIRENDIDSIIIFLTSHNELGNILLKDEIMFLTFICKFDDMNNRLVSALKNALKMVGVKQAIRFEERGVIYTIPLNSILYITTDTISRKVVIVTDNNEFFINKTLNEVYELLDGRFKQTHRACYVNFDKVTRIDKKKNEIFFDNKKIDLLSDTYKKEMIVSG